MNLVLRSAIALAALAVSAPAFAADPIFPAPAAPAPAFNPAPAPVSQPVVNSSYDWSGFYAGVVAGHGWGEADQNDTGDFTAEGWLAGGALGYNYQADDVVFGFEADLAWTDTEGASGTRSTDVDWLGTARGRVGYAFDGILPYVTGGFALADFNASDSAAGGFSTDEVQLGLTVGAGVEVGVTDNISLKTEYAYTDFGGDWDFDRNNGQDLEFKSHALKTGINFSF